MEDETEKNDDVLESILSKSESYIDFFSHIFAFLSRRTTFYQVDIAEQLVVNTFREHHPSLMPEIKFSPEFLTSTVAQNVEVATDHDYTMPYGEMNLPIEQMQIKEESSSSHEPLNVDQNSKMKTMDYQAPPNITLQNNSESYNGSATEKYSWSQTIGELEITVKLPDDINKSKDLSVQIGTNDLQVKCVKSNTYLINDCFTYPIKKSCTYWTINSGKLIINLEKCKERWWNALLKSESPIDISKIDCSRPLDELPEEHIAKIRELQWNQEQKILGLPTSDQLNKIKILEQAWNKDDSPFKGTKFDPGSIRFD